MKFWLFCFSLLLILVGYVVIKYGITSEEMFACVYLTIMFLITFLKHLGDDDHKGYCASYGASKKGEQGMKLEIVLPFLRLGCRIRRESWGEYDYIKYVDETFFWPRSIDGLCADDILADDWDIRVFEPNGGTVKGERLFLRCKRKKKLEEILPLLRKGARVRREAWGDGYIQYADDAFYWPTSFDRLFWDDLLSDDWMVVK